MITQGTGCYICGKPTMAAINVAPDAAGGGGFMRPVCAEHGGILCSSSDHARIAAENAALRARCKVLEEALRAIRLDLGAGKLITQGDGVTVNWWIPEAFLEHLRASPIVEYAIETCRAARKALDA